MNSIMVHHCGYGQPETLNAKKKFNDINDHSYISKFFLSYDISQDELFSIMLGLSYDTIVAIDIFLLFF